MAKVFTFLKHPVNLLLDSAFQVIPNLEKAMAVYMDEGRNQAVLKIKQSNFPVSELAFADAAVLQNFRKASPGFRWLHPSDLPFEAKARDTVQLTIFDEQKHMVLVLFLESENDERCDALLLFLNHQKKHFGPAFGSDVLSTDEKNVIGNLVYHSLLSQYRQFRHNREVLSQVYDQVREHKREISRLQGELDQQNDQNRRYLMMLIGGVFSELEQTYGIRVSLSSSAQDKLVSFEGSFNQLKDLLIHSVEMLLNMGFGQATSTLVLEPSDLSLPARGIRDNSATEQQPEVPERYVKTWHLLDKLEEAARLVINRQQKLTGENVGQACPMPISAPAISDALRNHRKKVASLLQKHPERWPILRYEFRPIQNILQSGSEAV